MLRDMINIVVNPIYSLNIPAKYVNDYELIHCDSFSQRRSFSK